jgi:formate dehydrogenase iron-sulfur subunit
MSYDNTGGLGDSTWRHVAFIEQIKRPGEAQDPREMSVVPARSSSSRRHPPIQLVTQDQDICGLPCLLTPGLPQPRG